MIALMTAVLVSVLQLIGLKEPSVAMQPPILAYVKAGEVWMQPLPEGTAQQVTQGANVTSLGLSSSGNWLAYQDRGQLWLFNPATADRQTLAVGVKDYAWSPQTDRLTYTSTAGTTLLDAASQTCTEFPGILATAWSPDGQALAYVSHERLEGTGSSGEPLRVATLGYIDVATGAKHKVFEAGRPSNYDLLLAGWSADGQEILVYTDPLFSASLLADGTALWAISKSGEPRVLVEKMLVYPRGLDIAGDRLVVSQGGGRFGWQNKQIAQVSLLDGNRISLTPDRLAAVHPAFSPDAQQIAYVAAPALPDHASSTDILNSLGQRRLWLMNADGSNQQTLTADDRYRDEAPRWSSDGQQLLFVRLDSQGEASLWRMVLGEKPQQIVSGLSYETRARNASDRLFGNYGYIEWNCFDAVW